MFKPFAVSVALVNKYCTFITRYRLQFDRESKGEIEARKKAAQEPLKYVSEVNRDPTIKS